jgi:hypothetical protein
MVKTATNPAAEAAAAARSAIERANQTKESGDIETAISEWENVLQVMTDDDSSEDQAGILVSYAVSIFLRWNLTHKIEDIRAVVSNLESALDKLPHSSTKTRYEFLTHLATSYESWYLNFKDNIESLKRAIQCWEDAYGLAVILRRTKEAVRSLLSSCYPCNKNSYLIIGE